MRLAEKHPNRLPAFLNVARTFDRLAQDGNIIGDSESFRLLYLNAAESYAVLPDHAPAANAFLKARKYTDAAYHYRMAGMFDEAVEVMKLHTIDPDLAESITYAAKFFFTTKQDIPSLHKAWRLCADKEEYLEFLQENGFEEQRVSFLDSVAEHEEAAQVRWDAGDYVSAILRFRRSYKLSSKQKAARCLLEGMRANVFFVTSYQNPSDVLKRLFELSQDANLSADEQTEVGFFRAVIDLKPKELKQYAKNYSNAQHTLRAILALDAWTRSGALDEMTSASDAEVAEDLLLCQRFGSVIKAVVRDTGILDSTNIQHLFGISSAAVQADETQAQSIDSQRTIQPTSFIHALVLAHISRGPQSASKPDPITLPKNAVDDMIRRTLLERLNTVIDKVDIVARRSRAFE
ncbi:hypothetical protein FRC04_010951, partial [Tulasnella sp. 424]